MSEPLLYRPQWGAHDPARNALSVNFMAQAAIDQGVPERFGLRKRCVPMRNTRKLTKRDMLWNDALPKITVDPETYRVEVDGQLCTCEPMERVPLAQCYVLK